MKLNRELIKKLAATEIAIDATTASGRADERILEVLPPLNPRSPRKPLLTGYTVFHVHDGYLFYGNERNLPIVPIADFFIESPERIIFTEEVDEVAGYIAGQMVFNSELLEEFSTALSVIEIESELTGKLLHGQEYDLDSIKDYFTLRAIFSQIEGVISLPLLNSEAYYMYSPVHKGAWSCCQKINLPACLRELPRRKLSDFFVNGNPFDKAPIKDKEFISKMRYWMHGDSEVNIDDLVNKKIMSIADYRITDEEIMSDIIDEHVTYAGINPEATTQGISGNNEPEDILMERRLDAIEESLSGEAVADVQDINMSSVFPGELALFWNNDDYSDLQLGTYINTIINADNGEDRHFAFRKTTNGSLNAYGYKYMTDRKQNSFGIVVCTIEEIAAAFEVPADKLRICEWVHPFVKL